METKIDRTTTIYLVTDPTALSVFADVLTETTLESFMRMVLGGLKPDENPTIYTDYFAAKLDAVKRLGARDRRDPTQERNFEEEAFEATHNMSDIHEELGG